MLNLFERGYIKYDERRNIVVSVNRCFDTIVDNDLISDRTQHGRVMNDLYEKELLNFLDHNVYDKPTES